MSKLRPTATSFVVGSQSYSAQNSSLSSSSSHSTTSSSRTSCSASFSAPPSSSSTTATSAPFLSSIICSRQGERTSVPASSLPLSASSSAPEFSRLLRDAVGSANVEEVRRLLIIMPCDVDPNCAFHDDASEYGTMYNAPPLFVATSGEFDNTSASRIVERGEIARLLLTLPMTSLEASKFQGQTPLNAATAWSKLAADDVAHDFERNKGVSCKLIADQLQSLVNDLIDFKLDPQGWRRQRFGRMWPTWKSVVNLLATKTPFDADCLDLVLDYLRHPSFMYADT